MLSKDVGIDLGTANTLVFVADKGIVMREPSVVAVDVKNDTIVAIGSEAKEMVGRTPGSVVAVRPLKEGVIADFDVAAGMLKYFIRKAVKYSFLNRPKAVICIPSGVTDVERRAVEDVARQAGLSDMELIEEPMAAAIGAGLPVYEPKGSMVVDIGGGTTEAAVISLGDIVTAYSSRVAGDKFDEAIISYVKQKRNVLIGEATAENVKISLGSAYPQEAEKEMTVRGKDLSSGLPKSINIGSEEIRSALLEPLSEVVDTIKAVLESTAVELSLDIMEDGIVLTGGGALLRGIDKFISNEINLPIKIAEYPLDCVADGTGKYLKSSVHKWWGRRVFQR